MKRDWEPVTIFLDDEETGKRVYFLWRYEDDGKHYLFVINDPTQEQHVPQAFVITSHRGNHYRVTDIASILDWESLMAILESAIGAGKTEGEGEANEPLPKGQTRMKLETIVELDGCEYLVYSNQQYCGEDEDAQAMVIEAWIERGTVIRENVQDDAIIKAVMTEAGLLRDDDEHPNVVVPINGVDTECEFGGVIDEGGQSYAILYPVEVSDDAEYEAIVRPYTLAEDGTETFGDDVTRSLFDLIVAKAEQLLATSDTDDEDDELEEEDDVVMGGWHSGSTVPES